MTVKINADTSDGLKLESDTSGAIDIQSAGVTKVSIDSVGNLDIQGRYSGNGNVPLFSVRVGTNQTGVGDAVVTKIAFDTVDVEQGVTFDTTNYRFTVPSGGAGYYQLNAFATGRTTNNSDLQQVYVRPYLNGSASTPFANFIHNTNYSRSSTPHISRIYNLSEGDYLEIYGLIDSVSSDRSFIAGQCGWSMHKLIT